MRYRVRDNPIPTLKEELARVIVGRLTGWTQDYAAAMAGTDQPRISDLRHGRLGRFSLERLILMSVKLGGEVTVNVAFGRRTPFTAAGREQLLKTAAQNAVRHRVEVADAP